MIEARSGYFEAYRHVLMGIQDVAMEEFSLQKHIVALDNDIPAPAYLQENPYVDITSLCSNVGLDELESLQNFNILENNLPQVQSSTMDNSQLNACQRILTKSLAVVQGPPGKYCVDILADKYLVLYRYWKDIHNSGCIENLDF